MIKEIYEHRSIRKFRPDEIDSALLRKVLEAGTRASNTGNMQIYSIVVTTDSELRAQLSPCHFGQPAAMQAPVILTFCADVNRFSKWCRQRGAEPCYENFAWYINGVIDVVLASQNVVLEAESEGLGACYLGTTTYNAQEIAQILTLPKGVIPVTTVVLGYPAQNPSLTDRLPLEGVIHMERYHDYSEQQIDRIWEQREHSEETAHLLEVNQLPNLARIFTERRYKAEDNILFSKKYFEALREQGFFE